MKREKIDQRSILLQSQSLIFNGPDGISQKNL